MEADVPHKKFNHNIESPAMVPLQEGHTVSPWSVLRSKAQMNMPTPPRSSAGRGHIARFCLNSDQTHFRYKTHGPFYIQSNPTLFIKMLFLKTTVKGANYDKKHKTMKIKHCTSTILKTVSKNKKVKIKETIVAQKKIVG